MNGTGTDDHANHDIFVILIAFICAAQIISGFISFGTLHIKTKAFEPWQW